MESEGILTGPMWRGDCFGGGLSQRLDSDEVGLTPRTTQGRAQLSVGVDGLRCLIVAKEEEDDSEEADGGGVPWTSDKTSNIEVQVFIYYITSIILLL